MTFDIMIIVIIIFIAIGLFLSERFRPDIVAMLVMLSLIFTQLITFEQAFASFANPAVITVGAVLIISYGLLQTGIADFLGEHILQVAGSNETGLIVGIMLTVGVMSAFMNNIGATAVLLPAVMSISRKSSIPPSKLLIPLSFASLMGGNLTLIGTPPNILASAVLREHTHFEFGFFDFLPMGIIILSSGILYMAVIGRKLLPHRGLSNLAQTYEQRQYLSEIYVKPNSPLVEKTIAESSFGHDFDLNIVGIIRDCRTQLNVHATDKIYQNDTLLVRGNLDNLFQLKSQKKLHLEIGPLRDNQPDLTSPDLTIAEALITNGSHLVGHCLRDLSFRQQYQLTVLALQRRDAIIGRAIADEPLRQGDILLVQGNKEHLHLLRISHDFLLLEPISWEERRTDKTTTALLILMGLLIVVTFGWLHVSVAAMMAVMLMILFKVIDVEDAYRAIDWKAIFFIAGMLSLGTAMQSTGAAEYFSDIIVAQFEGFGPIGLLIGMYFLAALFTQLMSNSAATVLVAPIAISVAAHIGADPRPFLMTVVIAASTIFLTPIGHAANILVFGPGRYRFIDYTKVGVGLLFLHLSLTLIFLPLIWPLFPE